MIKYYPSSCYICLSGDCSIIQANFIFCPLSELMNNHQGSILSNLINQIINTSQSSPNVLERLIRALEELTKAINMLPNNLQNVIVKDNIKTNINNNLVQSNDKSDAESMKAFHSNNSNNNQILYNTILEQPATNQFYQNSTSVNRLQKDNSADLDPFMQKLASLKNQRNDAFYKMSRNKLISDTYERNLNAVPQKIHKKFAPAYNKNDSKEIKAHKLELSLQSVANSINEMRIHERIHKNKLEKMEEEILLFINTKNDENDKQRLLTTYKKITHQHEERTKLKLMAKANFLMDTAYVIKDFSYNNNSTKNINHQYDRIVVENEDKNDTDIDDVHLIDDEGETVNRKRKNSFSTLSTSSDKDVFQKDKQVISNSQIPLPVSKNLRGTRHSGKMKIVSQPF